MSNGVLTVNAGSSSIKFALFGIASADADPALVLRGEVAGIGRDAGFHVRAADDRDLSPAQAPGTVPDHRAALRLVLDFLEGHSEGMELAGAGHRVVHGGRRFHEPVRITDDVLRELNALCPLAPHHQPHNVAAIRALREHAPELPQVACFDTGFHAHQPELARLPPLPAEYVERGLIAYGFHGLSYEFITGAVPGYNDGVLPKRLVIAHLGNGASMCAVLDGRSVATTMGFSTLEGLLMGTRCGSIDPGILLHLMHEDGAGERELTDLLYNRSGLLGVSGVSADMRVLLESAEPGARRAVELFCYRVTRDLGSLAAALGGLDALVFTGGIGEHAAPVRARVCADARWLGLELDAKANDAGGPLISAPGSRARAWVIPTDEERVIARHTRRLLGQAAP